MATNEPFALGSPFQENKSVKIERSAELHSYKRKHHDEENIENACSHHHPPQPFKITHPHNDNHIKLKTE